MLQNGRTYVMVRVLLGLLGVVLLAVNPASFSASHAYDAEHRLLSPANVAYHYAYAGDGLRTSKHHDTQCQGQCPAQTTYFTWSSGGSLPLLLQQQMVTTAASLGDSPAQTWIDPTSFIYGPTGILAEVLPNGTLFYYHTDQLGSVRVMSDSSGQIHASYNYGVYGNQLAGSQPEPANPFGFAGEYTDKQPGESGLIYLRSRYYEPFSAQFLTRDTVDRAHPYAYGKGSPVNGTDPTGHEPIGGSIFLGIDLLDIAINGPNGGNALALALDAVSLVLPVDGLGVGARVAAEGGNHLAVEGAEHLSPNTRLFDEELDWLPSGKLYRGLAEGEDPAQGLSARAPGAGNSPESHIQGRRMSQWISTSKSLSVIADKYGKHGIVEIDVTRLQTEIIDASGGLAGLRGRYRWYPIADAEVLVKVFVPPDAIARVWR